jgi:hypothetical protein
MPIAETVFDRHFKKLGGRLTAAPGKGEILSPEWFKRRYWDYLTKLRASKLYGQALRNVYFDYINNHELNAVVGFSKE